MGRFDEINAAIGHSLWIDPDPAFEEVADDLRSVKWSNLHDASCGGRKLEIRLVNAPEFEQTAPVVFAEGGMLHEEELPSVGCGCPFHDGPCTGTVDNEGRCVICGGGAHFDKRLPATRELERPPLARAANGMPIWPPGTRL